MGFSLFVNGVLSFLKERVYSFGVVICFCFLVSVGKSVQDLLVVNLLHKHNGVS